MDHAVVGHDVRGGDFCFVDHDAASGGDGEFRALHGFNFARFDICSHHLAGGNMVAEQELFSSDAIRLAPKAPNSVFDLPNFMHPQAA